LKKIADPLSQEVKEKRESVLKILENESKNI